MKTMNGFVAVAPLPTGSDTQVSARTGLVTRESRTVLVETEIIYGDATGRFRSTGRVWIRGEQRSADWNSRVFEVAGRRFVLCPETVVVGVWNPGDIT